MTKLISVFIVVVVVFCGWQFFKYWEKVRDEDETKKKAAAAVLNPASLPGLPSQLESSYQQAQTKGTAAMRAWLKAYDSTLQDPRKAWIELNFCMAITREDPAEAKRIFKAVKNRTPADSPVQPLLKQLEKSYE